MFCTGRSSAWTQPGCHTASKNRGSGAPTEARRGHVLLLAGRPASLPSLGFAGFRCKEDLQLLLMQGEQKQVSSSPCAQRGGGFWQQACTSFEFRFPAQSKKSAHCWVLTHKEGDPRGKPGAVLRFLPVPAWIRSLFHLFCPISRCLNGQSRPGLIWGAN